MNRDQIELALCQAVDAQSATGFHWWPGAEMAPIAYRRLTTFDRRNKSKKPTLDDRVLDLAKGLQAHFEPDIPYTHKSDWLSLAKELTTVFDHFGR